MRLSKDFSPRLARLNFTILMALAWSGVGDALRRATAAPATAPWRGADPAAVQMAVDEVHRRLDAIQWAREHIPRETFDLQAVVERSGKDPLKLFEWVRDQTFWVPYLGLLRGDRGVLMDRLGNSLDRSVLLYAMLKAAGKEPRLAHATLAEDAARDLLARLRPTPAQIVPEAAWSMQNDDATMEACAATAGLNVTSLRAQTRKTQLQQARQAEDIVGRAAEQTSLLSATMGKNVAGEDASKGQLAALRDHWWVQYESGGRWQDLDPLLPDAKAGVANAAASETLQIERLTDLGAANLHTLRIHVIVGYWSKGQVKEVSVLNQELLPAGEIGAPITLTQTPLHWGKGFDPLTEKDPLAAFKKEVTAQDEWMPVLNVGGNKVCRYCFNDAGDLGDNTLPAFAQNALAGRKLAHAVEAGAHQLGLGVGGVLGGGKIGGAGTERNKDAPANATFQGTQLTGEWIDYEIRSPGQPVRTIRRQIFDLLGQGAAPKELQLTPEQLLERNLALLGETEILPMVCQISPAFAQDQQARWALQNRRALEDLLLNVNLHDRADVARKLAAISSPPSPCYDWAVGRREDSRLGPQEFLASLNVVSSHVAMRPSGGDGISVCRALDIVANDIDLVPGYKGDRFAARLEQGVVDTAAEAALLQSCAKVENAGEIFANAATQEGGWVALRSEQDPQWATLSLPASAKAHILADLSAGYVCVVPRNAAVHGGQANAWWRIDPRTGQSLGMGSRGWGEAAEEYTLGMTQDAWAVLAVTIFSFIIWINCATNPEKTSAADQGRCAGLALTAIGAGGFSVFVAALIAGIPAVIDSFIDKYNATHKAKESEPVEL